MHPSQNEGTGLPLIEVVGLGVIPITTDVGIAREILTGELSELIAERNVEAFEHTYLWAKRNLGVLSKELVNSYRDYVQKVVNEKAPSVRVSGSRMIKENRGSATILRVRWTLRFLKFYFSL